MANTIKNKENMKIENHTVTIPADDYIKYREFYEDRELYDIALTEILTKIIARQYMAYELNNAKDLLLKRGIEFTITQDKDFNPKYAFIKVKRIQGYK